MPENESSPAPRFCPGCGAASCVIVDSIFVEYGDWNGDSYDEEGDVDVYRCTDAFCNFEFADVRGIPVREESQWVSIRTLGGGPSTKTTEQGI